MFIAGKMLDTTIRLALSLLLAALHKLSETGFPLSAYPELVFVVVLRGEKSIPGID
jgi:hypothetical protein